MTNYIQSEVVDLLNLDKKKLSKYDKLWGQLCSQNQDEYMDRLVHYILLSLS